MKKIYTPIHFLLSIALFLSCKSSNINKTATKSNVEETSGFPNIEQIDSCKECGFESQSLLKAEKVKLKFSSETNEWIIYGNNFSARLPCKFPEELLIENNEIIIDGKSGEVPNRAITTRRICIEKIY